MGKIKSTVINLAAGPGVGKSTTAAALFALMKKKGMSVELVTEYAKELVYEGRLKCLKNQLKILAEQEKRQKRLVGKVEYIITDSPLFLGIIYYRGKSKIFKETIKDSFDNYNNRTFYLTRRKGYVKVGRTQNEEEAKEIDRLILNELQSRNIEFTTLDELHESYENQILKLL